MAFNSADWTIDYALKTVTNNDSGIGTNLPHNVTGTYQGHILAFFQWLATEFASSAQMDDAYPIVSDTPTVFAWQNGWAFGHADDYKYLTGGDITSADGLDEWKSVYTIGSPVAGSQIYITQNDVELVPWWYTDNIDVLIKVKSAGVYIQSDDTSSTPTDAGIWLWIREFGHLYNHGFVNLVNGRSPIGLDTSIDGANTTAQVTVAAYGVDLGFIQRNFTGGTTATGPFVFGEVITQSVSGATGKFIIEISNILYIEDTTGVFDGTNLLTGGTSLATYTPLATNVISTVTQDLNNGNGAVAYNTIVDCNGKTMDEVYEYLKMATSYDFDIVINADDGQEYRSASEGVYTDVKSAPFGTIAGGTLYGARGVWFTNYAAASFVLTDATGTTQSPPNYQKVNANHPSLVGCNIFVAESSGGLAIKNQYTILGVTTSTIQATAALSNNKTPQTGYVKVGDTKYTYAGYSGDTLTGVTPDPTGETGSFYIPLLDVLADTTTELSDNIIQSGDITVITSVRKYGFKPYDVETTFSTSGLTFTPILATDPQAT